MYVCICIRTGDVKARDALAVRQLEPKLLDVMADLLNCRKLQVDPSLITAGKYWLAVLLDRRAGHLLHLPVVVSCASSHRKAGKQRSLRRGLGRLCRVLSDTLLKFHLLASTIPSYIVGSEESIPVSTGRPFG